MAEHDLKALMAAQLDRHLVFPLLEFLQERQLYSEPEFLEAKIRLLNGTNLVDYAMDIHKSLHGTDDVPEDMVKRRAEVVSRLRSLEEAAAPLVAFLQNPQLVQELRTDKQYNIHMLQERYQVFCYLHELLPQLFV
ncbi:eukaryotic translation initiation factor 3 subunit E-like isoform X4 [Miscanthus floridulus]|uniref:eukaryotic translation initiation factor 3 subunit E-like isoform X4 n=2 Tax=Miscanthus floridulus TaxID=154761 RepID=UPI0034590DAF